MPHYIITEHVAELAINAITSFKNTCDCIVVSCDDASPYKDIGFLEELSDVYIRNAENKGFAGNCNEGFNWILENEPEECNIVCANNDIEVYNNWLEEFERVMDLTNARIIGGLGFKGKIVEGMPLSQYNKNPGSQYFKNTCSVGGYYNDWVFPGGFYMVRKSVLEDYGLYDEGFIHGGYEDIDLFIRWQRAGEKLVVTPKVAYWHEEGATRFSEQEKGTQNSAEIKNRAYFKQKNGFDAHFKMHDYLKDIRFNY